MNPGTCRKLVAAAGFAGALMIAAVVAWHFDWPRKAPPPPTTYPIEFQTAGLKFDLRPESMGVNATIDAAIDALATDFGRLSLTEADKQNLAEKLRSRLQLVLDPNFETWRELVSQEKGEFPTEGRPDHPKYENFKEVWDRVGGLTKLVPLSSEGLQLREIRANEPPAIGVDDTVFLRTGDRGGHSAIYKDPPPGSKCVEVLLPALLNPHRTDPDQSPVRCKMAMRFYRDPSSGVWRACDLLIYFDKAAFGRKLGTPIY